MPIYPAQHRTNAGFPPQVQVRKTQVGRQCATHRRAGGNHRIVACILHIGQELEPVALSSVALNDARPNAMTIAVRPTQPPSEARQSLTSIQTTQGFPAFPSPSSAVTHRSAVVHALAPSHDAKMRRRANSSSPSNASAMPVPPASSVSTPAASSANDTARTVHDAKPPCLEPLHEPKNAAVTVVDPNSPCNNVELKLGAKLGSGFWGEVYVDAENPEYVIKRFTRSGRLGDYANLSPEENRVHAAPFEAEAFRSYYGEDSAAFYVNEDDGMNYMRMLRVPGVKIDRLPAGSLPADAIERYVDMLGRLQDLGILHGDLKGDNVLWDGERFNPIDMQNIRESYFSASAYGKKSYNRIHDRQWSAVVKKIGCAVPRPDEK